MSVFMIETFLTLPLLLKAAPVLIQVSAKLAKHLVTSDNKLLSDLIGLAIDRGADASQEKLEAALKQKPDLVLASHAQVFMSYTGWVLGELIHHFAQQPQFEAQKKDLEVFATQAPEGWMTFVKLGSPGLTPVHQDVFLRQMAAALARGDDLPPTDSVPFRIFFNWHVRLPAAVQDKLAAYLQTHLDNALQLLLLQEDQKASQAYKQIILSGINGIHASLQSLHQKLDVTVPVIVETHQLVKDSHQETALLLGQLLNTAKSNSAETRLTAYKHSLLSAFSAYQELALDNYAGADQACPDIWDIFVHPACSENHLRPEDMDAAQMETPPRLPAAGLLPLLAQDDHRRTVLLADPGMGKSTLIQSLIAHLASGRSFTGAAALTGLLPVPLILRDLVPLLPQDQVEGWTWDSLITVLLQHYQREETAPLLCEAYKGHEAEFGQLLQSSPHIFFLIDGLDEIGDLVKRRKIVNCIQDGIRAVSREARWLITSRVIGFEDAPLDAVDPFEGIALRMPSKEPREQRTTFLGEIHRRWNEVAESWAKFLDEARRAPIVDALYEAGYEGRPIESAYEDRKSHFVFIAKRLYLAPFDDRRQDAFTSRWFRHRHNTDHSRELMREVRAHHHDGVRIISRVPNLLCMMNMLKRSGKPLPDGRAALYDEIVKAYLGGIDAAYKIKPILGHACPFESSERRFLLSLLGAQMQQIRLGSEQGDKDGNILIAMPELTQLLLPAIQDMQRTGKVKSDHSAAELLSELLHHIASRSGLLIPRSTDVEGNTVYGFTHLSFLEFFAAEWLGKEFDRQRNRIVRRSLALTEGQTLTEADLDHEFPPQGPVQHTFNSFKALPATPAWHEPLIFLLESRKSDAPTLLRWLFPSLHAPAPKLGTSNLEPETPVLPLDAVKLAVQLAQDQELALSPATRQSWWRTLWTAYLAWPHSPWDKPESKRWSIAPLLLERAEHRAEVLQALAEVYPKPRSDGFQPSAADTASLFPPLYLSDCEKLTSSDLQHLSGLSGLKVLRLDGCTGLTDTAALAGLSGLRQLDLSLCTGLQGSAALAGLRELCGLEALWFFGCTGLSDTAAFAGLSGLRMLSLHSCTGLQGRVALAGLRELRGLGTLNLNGCSGLTREDVEALWQALGEKCDIVGP